MELALACSRRTLNVTGWPPACVAFGMCPPGALGDVTGGGCCVVPCTPEMVGGRYSRETCDTCEISFTEALPVGGGDVGLIDSQYTRPAVLAVGEAWPDELGVVYALEGTCRGRVAGGVGSSSALDELDRRRRVLGEVCSSFSSSSPSSTSSASSSS